MHKLSKLSLQSTVAVISVSCSFIIMFLLFFLPIPPQNEKLFDIVFGVIIGTAITSVYGWLYTQSKSAQKKTEDS